MERIYEGFRDSEGVIVTVNGSVISPKKSRLLYDHSPTGFEWGYAGSGPSQLALAILLDYTNDPNLSLRLHHAFKDRFIARYPKDVLGMVWRLTAKEIEEFMATQKGVVS